MMIKKKIINKLGNILERYNNFIIFPHISLDGDCICSASAIFHALNDSGKNVIILTEDKIPDNMSMISEFTTITDINDFSIHNMQEYIAISVDTATIDRLGIRQEIFNNAIERINIDHHISNTEYGDINIVAGGLSSTCELMYEVLTKIGFDITTNIATCLYTGISTDTGSFKFSSVTYLTHKVVAELIRKGVNVHDVTKKVYQDMPINRLKLETDIFKTIKLYFDNKVLIAYVTLDKLNEYNIDTADTDGIVGKLLNYNGLEASVFVKEKEDGEIKVSLRSKGNLDVNSLAKKFSGGGHFQAAGFSVNNSTIDRVIEKLLAEIDKVI